MAVMTIFFLRRSGHRRPDFDSLQLITVSCMSFGRSTRLQLTGRKGLTNAKVDLGLRSLLQMSTLSHSRIFHRITRPTLFQHKA
jgi:hypothetical protein